MRILEYTADVRDLITAALAALDRLLPRFQGQQDPAKSFADATPDLVALLTEIYQLRRFARLGAPHIDDPGGFGTGLDDSDAPTIMSSESGKENWDFQPWLAEKLQSAEGFVIGVCEICLRGKDAMPTPAWRQVPRYSDPGAECVRLLTGAKTYFILMLELLDSGELRIQQLIAEDDLDGEG